MNHLKFCGSWCGRRLARALHFKLNVLRSKAYILNKNKLHIIIALNNKL